MITRRALRAVSPEIPGVVLEVTVRPGTAVGAGDVLCLLESMKMEIPVLATRAGTVVSVHVAAGDRVAVHDTVATIE
ncbi:acetyl-CoA carboxylase biotin carboxyl carrier protein subunit [Pseudonocardia sp. NPDC049635]|uniref:acetyl-CoA carboxylase biotin carboxyl carrier protein subunit n=1 Tax=Pseudonocardia sp. NPDC049635 TaxID=3155506 RepID=UPI00340362F2